MNKKLVLLSLILTATSYGENFYEDSNAVRLKESIVSTSGFQSTARNTTKNVTVISNKELEDKNYQEISDVLKNVPGITINKNVFGTFVDLRGQGVAKSKSNVQILVDGVNINPLDPAHGVLPLDTIPVESIERVEVLPGGGSVIYGDGTVGGVVNIITKIESGKTYNNIGARMGSYGSYDYNVAVGQKITDKLAMQVAYNKEKSDGYRDGGSSEGEYFEGAFNYKLNDKNDLTFKYTRFEGKDKALDGLTKKEVDEDREQSGYDPSIGTWESPNELNLKRDTYNLTFKSQISEKLAFDLNTSYQDTSNEWKSIMKTYKFPWNPAVGTNSNGLFSDEKIQISPKLKYEYGEGSQFFVGIDYKKNKGKRESLNPGYLGRYIDYKYDMEKETFAGYVYNKTKFNKFEFTQGYRREKSDYTTDRYQSEYASAWPMPVPNPLPSKPKVTTQNLSKSMTNDAYELGVNYLYSDTGNIYTRFESGFRTPAPSELVDKIKDGKSSYYKENDLKEETYHTFEVGVKDYIGNSFISTTAFYTQTKDEILQTGSMPFEWKYTNLGKTERTGLEAQAEQYFGKLTLTESFTYVEAKIKEGDSNSTVNNDGNYIPGVSKFSANISAKYEFTNKLNTVLSTTYKDGYYLDEENKSGKVNDRIVTDITINYTLDNGLKLYTGINNLFGEKYYDNVYISDGKKLYDPAATTNYYAGFEYNF